MVWHHFLDTHTSGNNTARTRNVVGGEPDARGSDAWRVNPKLGGRRVERSTGRPRAAREGPREADESLTLCATWTRCPPTTR
jgi:hypothetical protein